MVSRMRVLARQEHDDPVEPGRQTAVRRRAVVERLEKEAEPPVRLLLRYPDDLHHPLLDVAPVDPDGARGQLEPVADEIVEPAEHPAGVGLEILQVLVAAASRTCDARPPTLRSSSFHAKSGKSVTHGNANVVGPRRAPSSSRSASRRLPRTSRDGVRLVGDEEEEVAVRGRRAVDDARRPRLRRGTC